MFRFGRVLGHDFFISWTALLLALFYLSGYAGTSGGVAAGLSVAAAVFFSILVHELGHAVVARYLGYGPCTIILHGFGGVTIHRRAKDNAAIQISLAGPAAGIGFGVFVFYLSKALGVSELGNPILYATVHTLLWFNLFWSVFNLLPIYPLDGGHVSEALLKGSLGPVNGRKATAVLSVLVMGLIFWYAPLLQQQLGVSLRGPLMIFLLINLLVQNFNLYNGRDSTGLGGY
jgi:stage IV sporulation protein FB